MSDKFLLGVIEGFYGKPWTFEQRKRLFNREKDFGFKYFMYAPKDEAKHRRLWRELHDEIEIFYLKELISAASAQNIAFVYAISPGLDMIYSSDQEIELLEQKLKQVYDIGCRDFALLFDDIDTHFHCSLDHKQFTSLAKAQVHVSNAMYKKFGTDCHLMFCPTEYCTSRAFPTLEESEYLQTVGSDLNEAFHVLWTGDRVISDELLAKHIKPVRKILKRKPLIWENLNANDYDPRRVFLGPYLGRDAELIDEVSGILTNPNNQFELNYIPFLSLSLWFNKSFEKAEIDSNQITRSCAEKWAVEVCRQLPCEEKLVSQIAVAAQENSDAGTEVEMDFEIDGTYTITPEEIELILSFNYLPHKAGPIAEKIFEEAKSLVETSSGKAESDWTERGHKLIEEARSVIDAIDKLLDCPNRQVAFEIYPMLSETRTIMDMLIRHFNWLLGEACPMSEEKRLGFYTRFGINGQFNSLLTSIMEPDSWFGGVMILPLSQNFIPKAAKFMCTMADFHDSALVETLLKGAVDQSPVLCYVMINHQDDVLALSVGHESTQSLKKAVETLASSTAQKTVITDAEMPPSTDDNDGNVNVDSQSEDEDSPESENDYISALSTLVKSLDEKENIDNGEGDIEQNKACCVFVFNSPKLLQQKMLDNFLLSVNTAVKTLPALKKCRLVFDLHFASSTPSHLDTLESMGYVKEEVTNRFLDRFTLFLCKYAAEQSMVE